MFRSPKTLGREGAGDLIDLLDKSTRRIELAFSWRGNGAVALFDGRVLRHFLCWR